MNKKRKQSLLDDGYKSYQVMQYTQDQNDLIDKVPAEWAIEGSIREAAYGGRKSLSCWIDIENNWFVVYLPPEDSRAFANSQVHINGQPIGFKPSPEVAKCQFHRWVGAI